jgi:hypothetical protein
MHRNLLSGSMICIALAAFFWIVGYWPTLLGAWGVKLLLGGGLVVPVTGAILAVLGFSGAGVCKRCAVAAAAINVVFCAAYWSFILK